MSGQTYLQEEFEVRNLLGSLGRVQSCLNVLYLLLSFPLGVFYFAFLVSGFSLGFGLLIIWVGMPILMLVFAAARGLAGWERQLANWLLDAGIPPERGRHIQLSRPWSAFKALAGDSRTWKSLLYLLLKFPFGLGSFVLCIVLLSVSIALVLVPVAFRFVPVHVGSWPVTSPDAALLCLAAGLILAVASILILNGVAALWRALAAALLTSGAGTLPVPPRQGPIIIP
jgi:hypothetical protein